MFKENLLRQFCAYACGATAAFQIRDPTLYSEAIDERKKHLKIGKGNIFGRRQIA